MLRLDTETVGYTGPLVLIQYQKDNEPIQLHYVWEVPVQETLDLIESLMENVVNLYNISFDSFHLGKMYNLFSKVKDKSKPPEVWEVFDLEKVYYLDAVCLKPKGCLDSFILIKRRQLQFLLRRRKGFKIMKVPKLAIQYLHPILTEFTKELHPLLFAKFFNRSRNEYWQVEELEGDEDFVNLILTFYPALGLKPIMKHMFKQKTSSIEIPKQYQPEDEKDQEYRPYNLTWPKYIEYHRSYWHSEQGIRYAEDDIRFLAILENYLIEKDQWPEVDIDSDLAWMVGQVRAKGFAIDEKLLGETIDEISEKKEAVPTAPQQAMRFILSKATTPEQQILLKNTDKNTLTAIANGYKDEFGQRAQAVLNQRRLDKQLDLLYKFQEVGRFHPDFDVSGTKSNRMSGRGGLNAHGINKSPKIRRLFLFADTEAGEILSGGDFNAQEVTILDAVIQDPLLREQLTQGISIHQLMWGLIHGRPPEECDKNDETYGKAKNGVFCLFYGGEARKFAETVDCSIERAEEILVLWNETYQKFANYRKETENKFASMRQPRGLGTSVEWYPPRPYEESLFGYRRYFSLENKVVEFFFGLANDMPLPIKQLTDTVLRRKEKGKQAIVGATQSSLYAAAFNIQAKNLRAAGNHKIQSTGAEVTKLLQAAIWNLQPMGVAPFEVQPFNVHDEIMCVNRRPELVAARVIETINVLKKQVPLLSITWKEKLENWSQK